MATQDSSAFRDYIRPEDGTRHILFNGPGDGSEHGHVIVNPDGSYEYARDVERNVYINRNPK